MMRSAKATFPMPVDGLVPYSPPGLLVDTLESVTPNSVVCGVTVGSRDSVAYTEDGELPVMCLLELMAQTISVWNAYCGSRGNRKNRFGLLVDVDRFIVTRNSDLPKGMQLRITARVELNERGYVKFSCDVKDVYENEIISTARLTGVVPSERQIHDLQKRTELSAL